VVNINPAGRPLALAVTGTRLEIMIRNSLTSMSRSIVAAAALLGLMAVPAAAQSSEIVLHTAAATTVRGDWQKVSDATAASGARMWNPDRGAAKVGTAYAAPADYFEMTFTVEAYRPYQLWLRGKADNDAWTNDSTFVQFTNAIDAYERPVYRIGTSDAAMVSIENCSGCGVAAWGWQDNGYAAMAEPIYFATSGQQTVRVQRREDGLSIDQIVLSSSSYRYSPPGAYKWDTLVLSPTTATTVTSPTTGTTSGSTSTSEIVLNSSHVGTAAGNWQIVADSTASGGKRIANADWGLAKLSAALTSPADYVDLSFTAQAGTAYRLWIRGKAENNSWTNDSVFVQFSGSVNSSGSAVYRTGTTSAAVVSIEDCSGCGLSGWGWADNGYSSAGPLIYFASSGAQTVRLQRREDGISIDQVVLSAASYINSAPGASKNDTTILTPSGYTAPTSTPTEPTPTTPTPPIEPSPAGGVRLRILEWNIRHGTRADGVYDIEGQATWMAAMNPDIIMLNEVEKYTSWGNEDQPARFKSMIQAKTGRTWYAHFAQEYGQWYSNGKGHLILSTYPIESYNYSTITASSGLGGGGVISQATIMVNYRTINLLLTHLDPYDQTMRLTQAQDAIRFSAGYAENRILVGDMNAWPDQSSILELNKTYYDSWTVALNKGTAYASSAFSPYGATKKGRIDYIMYSKNAPNLFVVESQVYDTRNSSGVAYSDHRPVVTTFEVR
jgi:endonuclease/exonuclease/phosphatase family metal-dependent hydrolase